MPSSDQPQYVIITSDRSDSSPIATTEENFAALTVSNVDTIKEKKPAWNIPSGTAAQTIMGDSGAAWPALAAPTPPRPSPKATSISTASSSSTSTDDLINSLDGLAVSVPAAPKRVTSLPEKVMPQQPRPNQTRRSTTGSDNTHNSVPNNNNRSPRFGNGSNCRGNNNNFHHHHNNNSRGGYRGRGRGGANWNYSNNSSRPPHLFWGNQVMARAPPPPPVSYSYDASAYMSPFSSPMGYDPYRAMFGNVQMGAMRSFQQPFAPACYHFGELARRDSILKQIEFYFSEDNLCRDIWLRDKMDAQGWVHISLIANFNKVKQLTNNLQLVLEVVRDSTVVEVQGNHIRRRDNWLKWLLPVPRFDPRP